jgi:hypothetical protein
MKCSLIGMRCSLVSPTDCQCDLCNSPGFSASLLVRCVIGETADEAGLIKLQENKPNLMYSKKKTEKDFNIGKIHVDVHAYQTSNAARKTQKHIIHMKTQILNEELMCSAVGKYP